MSRPGSKKRRAYKAAREAKRAGLPAPKVTGLASTLRREENARVEPEAPEEEIPRARLDFLPFKVRNRNGTDG